jgi:thymidylate kinase
MKELLKNIFTLFNRAGIRYVVLRNYEFLPDRMIDGDIDVLVDPQGITEATNMLRDMDFVITEEAYPHYFALHFQETSGEWLKLDLVTDLYYGRKFKLPINGNHREFLLGRRQPFRSFFKPAPEDEIVHLLLHSLLDKGFFKTDYQNRIHELLKDNFHLTHLKRTLDDLWGRSRGDYIISLLQKRKFGTLEGEKKRLVWNIIQDLSPRAIYDATSTLGTKVLHRVFGHKGLLVAFLGPDGSGKTTLALNLASKNIFPSRYVYMGADNYILPTSHLIERISRGLRKKHNVPKMTEEKIHIFNRLLRYIKETVKLCHDMAEFLTRYLFLSYRFYRKGYLVINDRYIYDLLLDRERFSRHPIIQKVILKILPKPDLLLFLETSTRTMHQRKGEHSLETLESMRQGYRFLQRHFHNLQIIETGNSVTSSLNKVIDSLWKPYLSNRSRIVN